KPACGDAGEEQAGGAIANERPEQTAANGKAHAANHLEESLEASLEALSKSLKKKFSAMDIAGMPAEEALAYAREIVTKGGAGSSGLRHMLDQYIDEKKVRKSKIAYGLVTTEFPSLDGLFLYEDAIPQGQLIDYIMASASCFPAVQKCVIGDKQFIDGGYRDNMPVEMAVHKGADVIIAVDLQAAGFVRKDTVENAKKAVDEFHLIKSPLDLGSFLIFDKENTSRIMTLGYLDTMRQWGRYDGKYYTFKKGIFSEHQLSGADSAAYILRLDPAVVYDEASLLEAAKLRIEKLKIDVKATGGKSGKELLAQLTENLGDGELHAQLLLYVAKSLREDAEKSLFLQPQVFKLLEKEIQAANFLLQKGLL
ncbi:MAG: hypothetical protein Q4C25_06630, partial [Bacillota bacterium]|nr:hypothetical protein [Bacillota bacterium]